MVEFNFGAERALKNFPSEIFSLPTLCSTKCATNRFLKVNFFTFYLEFSFLIARSIQNSINFLLITSKFSFSYNSMKFRHIICNQLYSLTRENYHFHCQQYHSHIH